MTEEGISLNPIEEIVIEGLRGFNTKQTLKLGIPAGETPGSGMTLIVGPNNGGKTTVVEAFAILSKNKMSISSNKRNLRNKGKVKLEVNLQGGKTYLLENLGTSSEIQWENDYNRKKPEEFEIFTLGSKKTFQPYFPKDFADREAYKNYGYETQRAKESTEYFRRLFHSHFNNKEEFTKDLEFVLGKKLDWEIDQGSDGKYYLKFIYKDYQHDSDGIGDGYISLLKSPQLIISTFKKYLH